MASGNESEDELATPIEAKDDRKEVISIGSINIDSANLLPPRPRWRRHQGPYSLASSLTNLKALTAEQIVSHTKVLKVKIGFFQYVLSVQERNQLVSCNCLYWFVP